MNGDEGNTEYLSLKSLLQQWKLPHLLQYFRAQNMSVEVLKMMKIQHIFELLQHFTCGDRIRFEYELEKWRYSIGCPLQQVREMRTATISTMTTPMISIPHRNISKNDLKTNRKNAETQTTPKELSANQSKHKNTHEAFFDFQSQKAPSSPSAPLNEQSSTSTATPIPSKQTPAYSPRIRVKTPPLTRDPHARGRPSADLMAQQMSIKLDAREILERCRPRGPELMKIYETNKRFRPVERVEIINLFAHYFYEHNIHLPVKLSYKLEDQILKLFPGERLEDYRTEKRGKIYIRLSNIKNNRRRAREAKATLLKSLDKAMENNDSELTILMNEEQSDDIAEDTEMREEENSNSSDKALRIFVDDIKQEMEDDEFLD